MWHCELNLPSRSAGHRPIRVAQGKHADGLRACQDRCMISPAQGQVWGTQACRAGPRQGCRRLAQQLQRLLHHSVSPRPGVWCTGLSGRSQARMQTGLQERQGLLRGHHSLDPLQLDRQIGRVSGEGPAGTTLHSRSSREGGRILRCPCLVGLGAERSVMYPMHDVDVEVQGVHGRGAESSGVPALSARVQRFLGCIDS